MGSLIRVEIDLTSPVTIGLNLLMVGVLVGCLRIVWKARESTGLVVFAGIFSGAVAGVFVPLFAILAAITVTVTDRRAARPPREHGRMMTRVLRHFRGRPDPEPRPF